MSIRYILLIVFILLCLPLHGHKLESDAEPEPESEVHAEKTPTDEPAKPAAHHEFEDDGDEFVGESAEREHGDDKDVEKTKSAEPEVPPEAVYIELPQVWYKKYFFEIFFVGILVLYAIQFFMGQKFNKTMVGAWLARNLDYFKEQFASIGIDSQQQDANAAKSIPAEGETIIRGAFIEQHSYNLFKFYATGRINCSYCLVTLELKRRQDLFTMTTFNLLWPELDRISYEIPLSFSDAFPCVFVIVKRNEMKLLLENNKILVISI